MSTNYMPGMTVPYMPEDQQPIIRAKIGLFELRHPKLGKAHRCIFGPWSVKVREIVSPQGTSVPEVKWNRDQASCVEYINDRKGNLLAWMADDPWWHNRIYILDNPGHVINMVNLHTHLGVIPGAEAAKHLIILRDMLKHEVEVIDVYLNGKRVFSASNKDKAEEEIEKFTRTHTIVKDGRLEVKKSNDRQFTQQVRKFLDYKPEIKDIIKKSKETPGCLHWTLLPEFANEIKPACVKEIKRLGLDTATKPGDANPARIIDAIKGMTEAQRKDLFNALTAGEPAPKKAVPRGRRRQEEVAVTVKED